MATAGGVGSSDPYAVFSIPRDASDADIRRRYKQLALKLHPDRRPPSEKADAERAFKQLIAANDILSDPAKRAAYNAKTASSIAATPASTSRGSTFSRNFGQKGPARTSTTSHNHHRRTPPNTSSGSSSYRNRPYPFADFFRADLDSGFFTFHASSPFNNYFAEAGAGRSRFPWSTPQEPKPNQPPAAPIPISATLENLAASHMKQLNVTRRRYTQHGTSVSEKVPIFVQLSPDMTDGHVITLAGAADELQPGSRKFADLKLVLKVRPHPRFVRRGRDLLLVQSITRKDARHGVRGALVEGLDGTIIDVASYVADETAPVSDGTVVVITGEGMPSADGDRAKAGDLVLTFKVEEGDGESLPSTPTAVKPDTRRSNGDTTGAGGGEATEGRPKHKRPPAASAGKRSKAAASETPAAAAEGLKTPAAAGADPTATAPGEAGAFGPTPDSSDPALSSPPPPSAANPPPPTSDLDGDAADAGFSLPPRFSSKGSSSSSAAFRRDSTPEFPRPFLFTAARPEAQEHANDNDTRFAAEKSSSSNNNENLRGGGRRSLNVDRSPRQRSPGKSTFSKAFPLPQTRYKTEASFSPERTFADNQRSNNFEADTTGSKRRRLDSQFAEPLGRKSTTDADESEEHVFDLDGAGSGNAKRSRRKSSNGKARRLGRWGAAQPRRTNTTQSKETRSTASPSPPIIHCEFEDMLDFGPTEPYFALGGAGKGQQPRQPRQRRRQQSSTPPAESPPVSVPTWDEVPGDDVDSPIEVTEVEEERNEDDSMTVDTPSPPPPPPDWVEDDDDEEPSSNAAFDGRSVGGDARADVNTGTNVKIDEVDSLGDHIASDTDFSDPEYAAFPDPDLDFDPNVVFAESVSSFAAARPGAAAAAGGDRSNSGLAAASAAAAKPAPSATLPSELEFSPPESPVRGPTGNVGGFVMEDEDREEDAVDGAEAIGRTQWRSGNKRVPDLASSVLNLDGDADDGGGAAAAATAATAAPGANGEKAPPLYHDDSALSSPRHRHLPPASTRKHFRRDDGDTPQPPPPPFSSHSNPTPETTAKPSSSTAEIPAQIRRSPPGAKPTTSTNEAALEARQRMRRDADVPFLRSGDGFGIDGDVGDRDRNPHWWRIPDRNSFGARRPHQHAFSLNKGKNDRSGSSEHGRVDSDYNDMVVDPGSDDESSIPVARAAAGRRPPESVAWHTRHADAEEPQRDSLDEAGSKLGAAMGGGGGGGGRWRRNGWWEPESEDVEEVEGGEEVGEAVDDLDDDDDDGDVHDHAHEGDGNYDDDDGEEEEGVGRWNFGDSDESDEIDELSFGRGNGVGGIGRSRGWPNTPISPSIRPVFSPAHISGSGTVNDPIVLD